MGAQQGAFVKNTFIDIDTSELDSEFCNDPRKVKSSPVFSFASTACGSDTEDVSSLDTLDDECGCGLQGDKQRLGFGRKAKRRSFTESAASPRKNLQDTLQGFHAGFIQTYSGIRTSPSKIGRRQGRQDFYFTAACGGDSSPGSSASPRRKQQSIGSPTKKIAQSSLQIDVCPHWTCRMVRNLPNDYTRKDLTALLDAHELKYDFVYLPIDWGKRSNLGYAFVNLVSHEEATKTGDVLGGFTRWKVASEKVCDVVWAKSEQQGVDKIILNFMNSPVMHPDVPQEFKPLLFNAAGQRAVFPLPTKQIRPPRGFLLRSKQPRSGRSGDPPVPISHIVESLDATDTDANCLHQATDES